jgi:hypothetical protein
VNCYDCAARGDHRDAVAVCVDCGAGLCIGHAVPVRHWLTRTQTIMRVERVEPPARLIRCESCQAAHVARGDMAEPAIVASSKP